MNGQLDNVFVHSFTVGYTEEMNHRQARVILGLPQEGALSEDQVKTAWREAAKRYHPDRNKGDADAPQKFKEAAQAYDVLQTEETPSAGVGHAPTATVTIDPRAVQEALGLFRRVVLGLSVALAQEIAAEAEAAAEAQAREEEEEEALRQAQRERRRRIKQAARRAAINRVMAADRIARDRVGYRRVVEPLRQRAEKPDPLQWDEEDEDAEDGVDDALQNIRMMWGS